MHTVPHSNRFCVFRFLANVSSYTETPAVACVVSGFLAALLSLLVSLRDLIEMMSIGTLLAYTLVSGGWNGHFRKKQIEKCAFFFLWQ